MFRIITVFAIFYVIVGLENKAEKREKRYLYGSGFSSGGGSCTVTGNLLYINSFFDHVLTADEQAEYTQYQAAVQTFLTQADAYGKQQQQIWDAQIASRNNNRGNRGNRQATTTAGPSTSTLAPPIPPTLPSFCSKNVTTAYYFDGCIVQNNAVYVGMNFSRYLSSDEISQLNTFLQQQQAYQDYVEAQEQQRYNSYIRPLAGNSNSTTSNSTSNTNTTAPVVPIPPNICSTIIEYSVPSPIDYNYYDNDYYYGEYSNEKIVAL